MTRAHSRGQERPTSIRTSSNAERVDLLEPCAVARSVPKFVMLDTTASKYYIAVMIECNFVRASLKYIVSLLTIQVIVVCLSWTCGLVD